MSNDIVVREERMTAVAVRTQVNLIQEVMQSIMKKDTHYGVIPGTQKPSLYKAGSEVLLTTFRIAVDPEIEDLSTSDEIRYRVKAYGKHQTTGIVVGCGIGECSSSEDKYKWRKAICDEEFDSLPPDRKRVKFAHGKGGGNYKVQQVRTEIADVANTILKMAKKRAQIDLTLTATGASDIFTQDIEDMPAELLPQAAPAKAPVKQPTTMTPEQKTAQIVSRFAPMNVTAEQLKKQLGKEIHAATKGDLESAWQHFEQQQPPSDPGFGDDTSRERAL